MSFLGLLLLILVFIMLWPVIKIAAKIWLIRRQFKNAYRQTYAGQYNEQHRGASASGQRTSQNARPRRQRKRIGADVGEYVEFEEIETIDIQPPHEPVKYKRQEQVSDAEWEEIS